MVLHVVSALAWTEVNSPGAAGAGSCTGSAEAAKAFSCRQHARSFLSRSSRSFLRCKAAEGSCTGSAEAAEAFSAEAAEAFSAEAAESFSAEAAKSLTCFCAESETNQILILLHHCCYWCPCYSQAHPLLARLPASPCASEGVSNLGSGCCGLLPVLENGLQGLFTVGC